MILREPRGRCLLPWTTTWMAHVSSNSTTIRLENMAKSLQSEMD